VEAEHASDGTTGGLRRLDALGLASSRSYAKEHGSQSPAEVMSSNIGRTHLGTFAE
jgi:hypothetical protein